MNILKVFRNISVAEGISNIMLFFVAMPLKYAANIPEAVSVVGLIHGLLFITFSLSLVYVWYVEKLTFKLVLLLFISCLIPFGMFWAEKNFFKKVV